MDPEAGITWLQAGQAGAVAVLLMLGPGWILGRALGFHGLDCLGLAGPLGTALLLATGWAADLANVAWTRSVGVASVVVATTVAAVVARWSTRGLRPADPEVHGMDWIGVLAGVSIATVGTLWKVIEGTRTPDALSHEPDAQFHLLAIAHLLDVESASPMRSGEVHYYDSVFYPGGFHSVAATVATWTGANAVVAAHLVLVLCAAVIWPLGVVALVSRTVSRSGWVLASSGSLALTAVFAPLSLLSLGGAWANLMSAALIPGALVPLAVLASQKNAPRFSQFMAATIPALAGTAAASLAQPNAAYSTALLGAAMVGPVVLRWGRPWALAYVLGLAAIMVLWVVPVKEVMLNTPVTVDASNRRAVLVILKNGDVPLWSGAAVAALTLAGVGIGLRRGRLAAGVAVMWLVTASLVLSLQLGEVVRIPRLTWPWFSGYARMATMVSLAVVLVASIAVSALIDWVRGRSAPLGSLAGAALVVALAVVAAPATAAGERLVHVSYDTNARDAFATPEEVSELRILSHELSRGDTVAVDPARGGVLLGLFGTSVVPVGPFYAWTPEIAVVATEMYRAASDPEVCASARELGVTHVLVGGSRADTYTEIPRYPGIDQVPLSPGFRLVASEGDYRLYEMPRACALEPASR